MAEANEQSFSRTCAALISPLEVSEGSKNLLKTAYQKAKARKQAFVGTEHLLCALAETDCRATSWLCQQTQFSAEDFKKQVKRILERQVLWAKGSHEGEPECSEALIRSLKFAKQIGDRPIADGVEVHSQGLVATEFLLAGLLLEGTGLALVILDRLAPGKVSYHTLLKAINVSAEEFQQPSMGKWHEIPATKPKTGSQPFVVTPRQLPDLKTMPKAPTYDSNWVIPGRLMIGAKPSASEARLIVKAGVNCFVNLRAELRTFKRFKSGYPSAIKDPSVSFLWFPIPDFDAPSAETLSPFVQELGRRLREGNTCFYVHCLGGHGRTGTVVSSLLSKLYEISPQEAREFGGQSCTLCREGDRGWKVHFGSEAREQVKVVNKIDPFVKKHKRGHIN